MARATAKCEACGDRMWFEERDLPPQAVQCTCGQTILKETGVEGRPAPLTRDDLDYIASEERKYGQ